MHYCIFVWYGGGGKPHVSYDLETGTYVLAANLGQKLKGSKIVHNFVKYGPILVKLLLLFSKWAALEICTDNKSSLLLRMRYTWLYKEIRLMQFAPFLKKPSKVINYSLLTEGVIILLT